MSAIRKTLQIVRNELRIEARSQEILISTTLFAVLIATLGSLAFYIDRQNATSIAPGILWLSIAFSGVLALSRSWLREREMSVIDGLLCAPITPNNLYFGKFIAVLIFMFLVETVVAIIVVVFCHLSHFLSVNIATNVISLASLLFVGTVGFIATGTLFAAMSVRSRSRELNLSIVLFPLCAPALLAAVVATREFFSGAELSTILSWLRILLAFDLMALVICPWLFSLLMNDGVQIRPQ
ncbi:MAG: heme exporter protein CcmB [Myxococcales bacterium]|nr:MAG: heme exporter protein CcmB [Myxococcales bacterium]